MSPDIVKIYEIFVVMLIAKLSYYHVPQTFGIPKWVDNESVNTI